MKREKILEIIEFNGWESCTRTGLHIGKICAFEHNGYPSVWMCTEISWPWAFFKKILGTDEEETFWYDIIEKQFYF